MGGEIDRFFTACAERVRQLPKMKRQRLGFAERACALAKQNAVKETIAQLSYGARDANGIGRQDRSIAKRKKATKRGFLRFNCIFTLQLYNMKRKKARRNTKKEATNYTFLNASLSCARKDATFSPLFTLTILSLCDTM